jgi:uncharacterized membrane protein YdbT with pleckstrin-like domain
MQEERTLWEGHPSHVKDLGFHLVCWSLVIGIPFSIWRYLETRFCRYEVTSERIRVTTGVLSRRMDEIELYRVKDTTIDQPFFLRLFGLANLVVTTSDASTPTVVLKAIPDATSLRENLRGSVEKLRDRKRVREVDYN